MKSAVIDIGTNSSRLAIFDVRSAADYSLVYEETVITRLGEGVDSSGALCGDAIDRTISALEGFSLKCRDVNAGRVSAVGTEVLRTVSNGNVFIEKAREAGIAIEVISGEMEGRLVFRGASAGYAGRVMTVDIGGGSTELATGTNGVPDECVSLRIGAVRMKDRFLADDPPAAGNVERLMDYCRSCFTEIAGADGWKGAGECIGVAGTVTTLAMMDIGLDKYDPARVHGHRMGIRRAEEMLTTLMKMDIETRRKIPGIQPGRADIIHAGAAILTVLMETFGFEEITVSERDIRYGLLERDMQKMRPLNGNAN